jgi:hypothetical protein
MSLAVEPDVFPVNLNQLARASESLDLSSFLRTQRTPALIQLEAQKTDDEALQGSSRALLFGRTGVFRGEETSEGEAEPRTFAITTLSVVNFIETSVTGRFCMGRSPGNQLCLPLPTVSKFHAQIEFVSTVELASPSCNDTFSDLPASCSADTGWQVTDLSSSNGTTVNDLELESGARCSLADGAHIGLGPDVKLKFVLPRSLYELLARHRAQSPNR